MAAGRKLTLTILGNAKGALSALSSVGDGAKSMGDRVSGIGKKMGIAFAAVSAGAGAAGFAMLKFVKGAEFAKQADDRLSAVTKTMGLFGEETDAVSKRLIDFADQGEYTYGILAESIKDTQSKLMTFANIAQEADIAGGLFDRATIAAIDLQAAGFGEATQNAVQLGKALQDPIKGITALARSGVTFTAQEKEKIAALVRSGELFTAQETLLKAVETQVSGTAKATTTDTFRIASAFGHVRDEIGTLLLPAVAAFADVMVKNVVPLASEIGAAFKEGGFLGGMQALIDKLGEFAAMIGSKLVEAVPRILAALGEIASAIVSWIVNSAPAMLAQLEAWATAFVGWVRPMIPKLVTQLQQLLPKVAAFLLYVQGWLVNKLIQWGDAFAEWVRPMIPKVLERLVEFAVSIGNWIANVGLPLLVERAQKLGDALVSWIGPLVRELPAKLVNLLVPIGKFILTTAIPKLVELGGKLGLSLIRWTLTLGKDLIIGLGGAVVALVAALPDLFAAMFTGLGRIAQNLVGFFIDKFKRLGIAIAEVAVNAVNFLIDKFNAIPLIPNIDRVSVDFGKLRTSMGLTADQMQTVTTTMNGAKSSVASYGNQVEDMRFKTREARIETAKLNSGLGGGGGDGDGAGGGGGGGGKSTKDAAKEAKEAMARYGDQLKAVQEKSRGVTEAQKSVVKAQNDLKSASKAVADAQQRFNMIVGGFPRTSKEAVAAQKEMESASKRLRDANLRQADSVRGVQAAEKRLADLRALTADPASVAEAERGLTRAKFRVEQANFDVIAAEKELAELRADPKADPIAIRQKEIALEEAKLSVIDATLGQADATRSLDEERNRAAKPEDIAEAERDLARAKIEVQDAIDDVTEATAVQSLAQLFLDEVLNGAREGSDRYRDALDDLNEAREREVDAIDNVADAIQREKDAVYELLEARRKLAEFGAGLSPSQVAGVVDAFNRDYGTTGVNGATGAAGSNTVNIVVDAKPMQNKTELANEIVDALKAYERSNGLVPIRVAEGLAIA